MIILIDSRETLPLRFKHPQISGIERVKLDVGDYGCRFEDGYAVPIVFERKSIPDLFGTFGKGYERFKREIVRAQEAKVTLKLIIEGNLSDVAKGIKYSQLRGASVIKKCFTLYLRYGLKPVFCKDRREMQRYIVEFYCACGREYIRKKS